MAIRASLPKGRNGHKDQARVHLSQDIIPQPQFLQVSWRKAFHDDIVSGEQAQQQVAASCGLYLQGNTTFVGIKRQEEGTALWVGLSGDKGWFVARCITASRRLDFQRPGALIGQ